MKGNQLESQVLKSIIKKLGIEAPNNEFEFYDIPLFSAYDKEGVGLQLDSIDSLEVIIAIKQDFGVKIDDKNIEVLRSVSSISDYIRTVKAGNEVNV